ncbi:putative odorant receptor 85e [Teleopsis dalmanni]|uniref:putative odorant receptor 85e n=1 Tax=Teleopsis dalmanni TaxID=139649 RepID=UPI0018CE57F7|nr:putative odorant receptor 85e [Teleopsis dalmanni]
MFKTQFYGGKINLLYSDTDFKRVNNLFSAQIGFMTFMGQIPFKLEKYLPKSLYTFGWLLARFYCAFVVLQTLHLALLFIKTTIDMLLYGKLEEITDSLTMAIIYSFSCFATCYWQWRSVRLVQLLQDINNKYRHHSLVGLTFVSARTAYRNARNVTIYWLIACISGVMFWGMAPIILHSHTLPLKCWYPFDALQPFVYELVYALQLLGQLNMGTTFGNGSALFVSIVIIMLGQFDVLFCSLKNLDVHARLFAGENIVSLQTQREHYSEISELNQYLHAEELQTSEDTLTLLSQKCKREPKQIKQALQEAFIECVHLHRFIIESCNMLEELFNPYCLVKSLQITMQLCLLVFVGVAGEGSTVRSINLVQYLALTLSELLMFTYCGELLRNHSVRSGDAFWRSDWWTHGKYIRKEIVIFLINSQRYVRITAGKFYLMDVERLRSVVAQAFSFLTLLQKLAAKNNK